MCSTSRRVAWNALLANFEEAAYVVGRSSVRVGQRGDVCLTAPTFFDGHRGFGRCLEYRRRCCTAGQRSLLAGLFLGATKGLHELLGASNIPAELVQ